jgi:hypothetical protein
MNTKTQILLHKTTRERLRTFGKKGETWDEVLNRLMDEVDKS